MKIKQFESTVLQHARTKRRRRERYTVVAKEINLDEEDDGGEIITEAPKIYPKTSEEQQFLQTVFNTFAGCPSCPSSTSSNTNNNSNTNTNNSNVSSLSLCCEKDYFIFSDMTEIERQLIIDVMVKDTSIQANDWIYQQGNIGQYFFIIQEGIVELIRHPSSINEGQNSISSLPDVNDLVQPTATKANGATLTIIGTKEKGQSFGEIGLLYDEIRTHSARARTNCILWKIHQKDFRYQLAKNALGQETKMMNIIKQIPTFNSIKDDTTLLRKFANALEQVVFMEGQRIVNKGDVGNVFYIIEQGQVKVHDIGTGDSQTLDQILTVGDWFGERSLLTGERRAANVTAISSQVIALAMDREAFQATFGSFEGCMQHQMKKRFLKSIPIFANSDITPTEFDQLAAKMDKLSYRKGVMLDQVGKPNRQELFIVQHGKIAIYDGDEKKEGGDVFTLKDGSYFGDKHIQENPPRLSTRNVVVEENATCWTLSREAIETVIGNIDRLGSPKEFRRRRRISVFTQGIFMTDLDMEKRRLLGQGGFGKVWLVQHKETGMSYALKAINKRKLINSSQVKSVLREKEILSTLNHPFILRQVSTFQDENYLYILLDLIQGGELYSIIESKNGVGLEMNHARFYSACIVDALAHFHQRSIAYRDMKTENIMIGKDGYCVIVDLGFAKVITNKSFTLLGTPEYLAPEILMSKGHDKSVVSTEKR